MGLTQVVQNEPTAPGLSHAGPVRPLAELASADAACGGPGDRTEVPATHDAPDRGSVLPVVRAMEWPVAARTAGVLRIVQSADEWSTTGPLMGSDRCWWPEDLGYW